MFSEIRSAERPNISASRLLSSPTRISLSMPWIIGFCITICITLSLLPATVFSCRKYQNRRGNRIWYFLQLQNRPSMHFHSTFENLFNRLLIVDFLYNYLYNCALFPFLNFLLWFACCGFPEGIESLTENIIKLDNYTSHLPHISDARCYILYIVQNSRNGVGWRSAKTLERWF